MDVGRRTLCLFAKRGVLDQFDKSIDRDDPSLRVQSPAQLLCRVFPVHEAAIGEQGNEVFGPAKAAGRACQIEEGELRLRDEGEGEWI